MAQEITVGLRFTADTAQARQQLNALKQDLMGLNSLNRNEHGLNYARDINEATIAAAKLKTQLDAATNVKTGNLDLTKFAKNLKQSGTSLEYYRQQLQSLGPDGQQAFMQLANSIQSAEVPIIRVNKLFNSLWDSLKRTAKWQFSSTAIHALMGAVQGAYRYAQDLNESLNNIRIVTGQSTEQMAKFAEQANKSAKALSTTTTAYTDAALIYYQQGLSDQDVKERTDVTIKMANVTRESAETVSQQMTAVWNNFAKGGEALELYADKMTALGASTASSSAEIAQGLEKFAGVADTIGLSFDYAAAALTTITATTRMSADTVGTALKTLFSRLESLKLGESLEDGTDLTKYSAALAAVGVDIKDSNGELKQMDQILDETMDKWKQLSKDQQIALAQTVAGQRQYTQFVTLMDNSDFFKKNLATEAGAAGTLQDQADIYAESWEGARKRVEAAAQGIYQHLLDDKFFIKVTDGLGKILGFVDKLIQSMGGMPGLLSTISALVLTIAGNQVANKIRDIAFSLQTILSGGSNVRSLQSEAIKQANKMTNGMSKSEQEKLQPEIDMYSRLNVLQQQLNNNAHKMTEAEIAEKKNLIEIQQLREQELLTLQKSKQAIKERAENIEYESDELIDDVIRTKQKNLTREGYQQQGISNSAKANWKKAQEKAENTKDQNDIKEAEEWKKLYEEEKQKANQIFEEVRAFNRGEESFSQDLVQARQNVTDQLKIKQDIEIAFAQYKEAIKEQDIIDKNDSATDEQKAESKEKVKKAYEDLIKILKEYDESVAQNIDKIVDQESKIYEVRSAIKAVDESIDEAIEVETKEAQKLGATKEQTERLNKAEKERKQTKDQETDAIIRANSAEERAKRGASALGAEIQKTKGSIHDYASAITKAAGSLSSFISAWQSLSSIGDVLSNDDLSTWEKFTSVLQSVAMGVPMLLNGFSQMGGMIKDFSAGGGWAGLFKTAGDALGSLQGNILNSSGAIGQLTSSYLANNDAMVTGNVLREISNELTGEEDANTVKTILNKALEKQGIEGTQKAKVLENIAKALGIPIDEAGAEASVASGIAKMGEASATETAAAANTSFLATLLPLLPIILGVTAVIAALSVGIYLLVKAYNKESDAAKDASESLAEQQKRTEQLESESKELTDSIKDLREAYASLESARGTSDWDSELEATNEKAKELIKTFNLLKGADWTYQNGVIIIKDQALNDIELAKNRQVENAHFTESAFSMTNDKAQNDLIVKNILNDLNSHSAWANGYSKEAILTIAQRVAEKENEVGVLAQSDLEGLFNDIGGDYAFALEKYVFNNLDSFKSLSNSVDVASKKIQEFAQEILGTHIGEKLIEEIEEISNGDAGSKEEYQAALGNLSKDQARLAIDLAEAVEGNSIDPDTSNGELRRDLKNKHLPEEIKNSEWFDVADDQELAKLWAITVGGKSIEEIKTADYKAGKNGYSTLKIGDEAIIDDRQDVNLRKEIQEWAATQNIIQQYLDDPSVQEHQESALNLLTQIETTANQAFDGLGNAFIDSLASGELTLTELLNNLNPGEYQNLLEFLQLDNVTPEEFLTKIGITKEMLNNAGLTFDDFFEKLGFTADKAGGTAGQKFLNAFKSKTEDYNVEKYEQTQNEKGEADYKAAGFTSDKDLEEFRAYRDLLIDSNEELKNNLEAANAVAVANKRLQKGVESLVDKWDDYDKIMTKENATLEETSEIMPTVNKALKNMLNLSDEEFELLPPDFAKKNWKLIQDAVNGVEGAVDDLRNKAGEEMLLNITAKLNDEQLQADLIELNNAIAAYDDVGFEVGVAIDQDKYAGFIADCNGIIQAAQMTQAQAEAYFRQMGYDVELEEVESPPKITPQKVSTPVLDEENTKLAGVPIFKEEALKTFTWENVSGGGKAYAIKTITPNGSYGGGVGVNTTTPSSSRPSSKGGGGGGGGSGSEKKTKKASDETERYHEINEQLDDMSRKLDQIGTAKDRAFGAKHIAAIDAEIAALEEESKLLDEKFKETKEYFDQDAAALNAYGAIYDSAGRITNYNKIIENAVTKYNAGSIDDEEYDHIKDALSKYEETLNQMEDLTEERAENARKILDAQFEKVEYSIEVKIKINDETNKIIDWQMSQLEDQKFASLDRILLFDQQVAAANQRWMIYMNGVTDLLTAAGATQEQIQAYLNGDVEAIANLDNLTQQVIDDLGEQIDGLREEQLKLIELQKSLYEELNMLQEEYNEEFERTLSQYDQAKEKIEFFQNAIDVIGKDNAGISADLLKSLRRGQIEIQYGNIKSLQSQLKMNETWLHDTQEKLKTASDTERAALEDLEHNLMDKVADIKSNIYSIGSELIDGLKEDFEANIDAMFEEFEKKLSGMYDSFNDLSEAFDQAKTLKEQYIPAYQKLYELSKLNRQLNKDISETDSIRGKQKLRELQEEIVALQADGVELSEYDLKNMQNKYNLRLAEIALEESQNAKNTVRLTRDASGNYSYIYTANAKNIDEAEQKYEDALFKMQEENENYLNELSELYIQIQTEMNEKLVEAAKAGKSDAELDAIREYYLNRLGYVNSQMNNALGNNGELYNKDYQSYKNSLQSKIAASRTFTKDFKDTVLGGVLSTYSSLGDYSRDLVDKLGSAQSGTGLLGQISNSIKELNASYETILSEVSGQTVKLGEVVQGTYDQNGQAIVSFADLAKVSLADVLQVTADNIEKTEQFGEEAQSGYQKAANEVSKASQVIIQKLQQMTTETMKAQTAHEALLRALERKIVDPHNVVTNTTVNVTKNVTSFESSGSSDGGSGGGGGYTGNSGTTNSSLGNNTTEDSNPFEKAQSQLNTSLDTVKNALTNAKMISNNTYHWAIDANNKEIPGTKEKHKDFYVNSSDREIYCGICGKRMTYKKDEHGYYTINKDKSSYLRFTVDKENKKFNTRKDAETYALKNRITTAGFFDTGGYTGAWGTDGKLAMLHEKELVLNKQDTKNMLATVDFVRQLSDIVDLQALSQKFNNAVVAPAFSNSSLSQSNSNMTQEIHIDASFPGVTAREEIEQAFSDLALQAAQYVNKY